MKTIVAAVVATTLAAGAAQAQDFPADRPTIIVVGVGEAERQAETFSVSVSVEGRGVDQVAALRALAATQSRVSEGLLALEGLSHGEITTRNLEVNPLYAADCRQQYDEPSGCPPTGYVVTSALTFEGQPVGRAGDAVSLASELGATRATFSEVDVVDRGALEAEARASAYGDAVRQAEALAQASGQRLVRPLRVMPERYNQPDFFGDDSSRIVVTGARIPAVRLDVAPPPVTATARLTVLFESE